MASEVILIVYFAFMTSRAIDLAVYKNSKYGTKFISLFCSFCLVENILFFFKLIEFTSQNDKTELLVWFHVYVREIKWSRIYCSIYPSLARSFCWKKLSLSFSRLHILLQRITLPFEASIIISFELLPLYFSMYTESPSPLNRKRKNRMIVYYYRE